MVLNPFLTVSQDFFEWASPTKILGGLEKASRQEQNIFFSRSIFSSNFTYIRTDVF